MAKGSNSKAYDVIKMIYGKQKYDSSGKPLKEVISYTCPYCKHKFEQYVRRLNIPDQNGKDHYISSQVPCPKCGNILKTF